MNQVLMEVSAHEHIDENIDYGVETTVEEGQCNCGLGKKVEDLVAVIIQPLPNPDYIQEFDQLKREKNR